MPVSGLYLQLTSASCYRGNGFSVSVGEKKFFLQIIALNLLMAGQAEWACSGLSPQCCTVVCVGGGSPEAEGSCGVWGEGAIIPVWNPLPDVSVIQTGAMNCVQTQASWRESIYDPADKASTGTAFKMRHIFQILRKTKIYREDFPGHERN